MKVNINSILQYSVVALYFAAGIYVAFSNKLEYIPKNVRVIFAFLIIIFGAYRLSKYLAKKKNNHD